eukprot:CAMPEP_0206317328 /NCGR_PEP_ID=MMETSP0106_2-20121207/16579_1 /ASSEMBLY_ACC=CAM_ASM_000206 /TAXON_ID=81532 /ORGANISM="Acanthoeca-like sp., Strain 10tr" /LENGTH=93 /DNA_ID=CAMNT_0053748917 /DNA_START=282 /DNA_END=559 /DNA_ORIENTATION=+
MPTDGGRGAAAVLRYAVRQLRPALQIPSRRLVTLLLTAIVSIVAFSIFAAIGRSSGPQTQRHGHRMWTAQNKHYDSLEQLQMLPAALPGVKSR